eukprot:comp22020_c0_seq1/m.31917 comp22020_c0_seq1/g.31917  ORF comp22020_c0_seq1/g.31917 comp22020_c0_seq1/m.31917 type:complete len:172 (-) comp22020_c0_seq1:399-914(-)
MQLPLLLLGAVAATAQTTGGLCGCGQVLGTLDQLLPSHPSASALNSYAYAIGPRKVTAQRFRNPAGHEFTAVAAVGAVGLQRTAWASEEATWYAGYRWHVLHNPACPPGLQHAGWHFVATTRPRPGSGRLERFDLLLADRLHACNDPPLDLAADQLHWALARNTTLSAAAA